MIASLFAGELNDVAAEPHDASGEPHRGQPQPPPDPRIYLGGTLLPPDMTLGASPVRTGSRIGLNRPLAEPVDPAGAVELCVVSGPDAGTVYQLPAQRELTVGRAEGCAVTLAHETVPLHAFELTDLLSDGTGMLLSLPGAAVQLDGQPVEDGVIVAWKPGQQVAVGDLLLELRRLRPPDATLEPSADALNFSRPPRLLRAQKADFRLPAVPAEQGRGLFRRGSSNRQAAAERMEYAERIGRIAADCPDPVRVLKIATGPRLRLWERRRTDPDYLLLRVGTADLPSAMAMSLPDDGKPRARTAWKVPNAPVVVPLAECGVLGIGGPPSLAHPLGRWLATQVATLHSPRDVQLMILTDSSGQTSWEWTRWLPHTRSRAGNPALTLIGKDLATVSARIGELNALISERSWDLTAAAGQSPRPGRPDVVVVFDGVQRLRSLRGAATILRDGPRAGVFSICLDDIPNKLPRECGAVVDAGTGRLTALHETGGGHVLDVRPDLVNSDWCAEVARSLAPVRDAGDGADAGPPDSTRLFDVLDLDPLDPDSIARRWEDGPSTAATIGMSGSGPFAVDLRADGPHGLIGGTTGSGKSELLQTLVASLAVINRPDEMTFLLVDYKGGSAFRECGLLPHTVGMVTDLDAHLATRAEESLVAELARREYILLTAGAKDIDDYHRLWSQHRSETLPGLEVLPRLVIIIDEFAALMYELPDFMHTLVSIAQRGRSLGIHLILATQRPAGVVSADIRANTNLRIALRMADPAQSMDLIEAGDAASIPSGTPGRAYVRSGYRLPAPVQMSRIGGLRPRTGLPGARRPWLSPVTWTELGRVLPGQPAWLNDDEQVTDLTVLVKAIELANEQLAIPRPHQPWLPPLPGTLLLSDVTGAPAAAGRPLPGHGSSLAPVAYGIDDLPAGQAQRPAVIDFASFGHMLAVGAPVSGRTQLLHTVAGSIAATQSCADVHLYCIDSGDGVLLPIADLPHCGAVVTPTETARTARLADRLNQEITRRQELLARSGFTSVGEQRAAVSDRLRRLSHIIVMVNHWEPASTPASPAGQARQASRAGQDTLTDVIMRLLAEGARVGMHVLMTGDRTLLTGRMAAMAGDNLVFRLTEREDYSLAGLPRSAVPIDIPPGRAVRAPSGTETQIALLDGEPTGLGQAAALGRLATAATLRDAEVALTLRPFQVDVLALTGDRFHVGDALGRPVGREDILAWLRDRHASGASVALLGPRRAGKTWVLAELGRRLEQDGSAHVRHVVVPHPSSSVDTPDALARLLDRAVRAATSPAEKLLDQAQARSRSGVTGRVVYLLDEVGRLVGYDPAAVSWLRDLGQAGAWLVYTGTEKDWHGVVRWALTSPGSSFGNDVNARLLGPIDDRSARLFLTGTAANLRVNLGEDTAAAIIEQTGSWPFYLQVAGDAVVRQAQAEDLRPLTDTHALRWLIEQRLLDEWTHHFQARWAEIGPP
ncbi:MAG TPA: FtsK/SpoIIIE domain-containing protein, partial [Streptosporangiaceae bacterium]